MNSQSKGWSCLAKLKEELVNMVTAVLAMQ
jgi:hypothetical protein